MSSRTRHRVFTTLVPGSVLVRCGDPHVSSTAHLRVFLPLITPMTCSLRADVERLAFSVLCELDQEAQPVSVRFTKSIIRSRAALTYEAAQNRIDGRDTDDVTTGLRLLMKVAKILRQRRCALQQLQVHLGTVSSITQTVCEHLSCCKHVSVARALYARVSEV